MTVLHPDNPRCGPSVFTDDTRDQLDRLSAQEIAYIWRTEPNWRLPGGCYQRNLRHAEAVSLVAHMIDSEIVKPHSKEGANC